MGGCHGAEALGSGEEQDLGSPAPTRQPLTNLTQIGVQAQEG